MSWEEALVLVMALLVAAACTWTPQLPSNMPLYVFRVLILQKSLKPACRVYVGAGHGRAGVFRSGSARTQRKLHKLGSTQRGALQLKVLGSRCRSVRVRSPAL